jgi:hypothetical protein
MTHDCDHQGHVWLDENDRPYARQRGKDLSATVDVHCQHCEATRALPKYSQFSGARAAGQPIDNTVPSAFRSVLDRALAEVPTTPGSVPKP